MQPKIKPPVCSIHREATAGGFISHGQYRPKYLRSAHHSDRQPQPPQSGLYFVGSSEYESGRNPYCLLSCSKAFVFPNLWPGVWGLPHRGVAATSAAGRKHTSVCISAPFGKMVDERSGLPLGPPTTIVSYAASSLKNATSSTLFIITVCGK